MTSFQYIVLMENNIKQNYENTGDLVLSKKNRYEASLLKMPIQREAVLDSSSSWLRQKDDLCLDS